MNTAGLADRTLAMLGLAPAKSVGKPSEGEQLAKMVGGFLSEGQSFREDVFRLRQMDECYDFYMGKHYAAGDWRTTHATSKINHPMRLVEALVPMIMDSRPRFSALARHPDDEDFARGADCILDWGWERNKMQMKLPENQKLAFITGTSFWKVHWDPFRNGERGEGVIDIVPFNRFLHDPMCPTSDIQDASWVAMEVLRDPYQLAARYEEQLKKLGIVIGKYDREATIGTTSTGPTGFAYDLTDSSGLTHTIRDLGTLRRTMKGQDSRKHPVVLREVWFRTTEKPMGQVVLMLGDRILDGPKDNPTPGGYWPFVKHVCMEVPGEVAGRGIIQDILPIVKELNRHYSQITDHADLLGFPPLIRPASLGKGESEIQPHSGWQIPVNTEAEANMLKYLNVPPIGDTVFKICDMLRTAIDEVSGLHDVQQGERPQGVLSGRAVQGLQEAGQVRVRQVTRNMESAVEEMGRQYLALYLTYSDEKQVLTTMDKSTGQKFHEILPSMGEDINGNPAKFFEVTTGWTEEYDDGTGKKFRKVQGKSYKSGPNPNLHVRVETDSLAPVSQAQQFQQVMDMYDKSKPEDPIMVGTEVLRHLPWINAQRVMQEAQKLQQAHAPQGPPPPQPKVGVQIVANSKDALPGSTTEKIIEAGLSMADAAAGMPPPQQGGQPSGGQDMASGPAPGSGDSGGGAPA